MPILNISLVLLALGVLLGVSSRAVKSGKLKAETGRKSVHVGMGLICMCFPWLFDSVLSVQILGIIAVSINILVRMTSLKDSLGSSLFSVKRLSIGELLFPIAVAWLFTLNFRGEEKPVVFYIIPLLLLTLADTAGAIAGTRFGKLIYKTSSGQKSVEGSLAFFVVALLCTFLPLCFFTPLALTHILYLSITVALFITAVEGASGMGMDNLLIPLGAYFLLDYYHDFTASSMWVRAISLLALLALLVFTRRKHSLNGGAVLTAALLCFTSFMLGGIYCLLACLLLLARHIIAVQKMPNPLQYSHSIDAVLAISAPAVTWLVLLRGDKGSVFFIVSLAVTIGMLHIGTQKFLGNRTLNLQTIGTSTFLVILVMALTLPLIYNWKLFASTIVVAIISSITYHRVRSNQASLLNDWIWLSFIVSIASTILYYLHEYYHLT